MTDDGLTSTQRAWLDSSVHREAFSDLSASDINRMPMSDFARMTGRTLGVGTEPEPVPPGMPRQASAPAQTAPQAPAPEAQGIDVTVMDMQTYAQHRAQLGVQGREYGRGILDGGSTADWIAAAQRKSGRAAMNEANVQQAPRLEGRTVLKQDPLDTRPAVQRFATPGNVYGS